MDNTQVGLSPKCDQSVSIMLAKNINGNLVAMLYNVIYSMHLKANKHISLRKSPRSWQI